MENLPVCVCVKCALDWDSQCEYLVRVFRAFCALPSLARIKRPRWLPTELNDRHLRSDGKIGDCEQSIRRSE